MSNPNHKPKFPLREGIMKPNVLPQVVLKMIKIIFRCCIGFLKENEKEAGASCHPLADLKFFFILKLIYIPGKNFQVRETRKTSNLR